VMQPARICLCEVIFCRSHTPGNPPLMRQGVHRQMGHHTSTRILEHIRHTRLENMWSVVTEHSRHKTQHQLQQNRTHSQYLDLSSPQQTGQPNNNTPP
jgi:hypothetical protein